MKITVFNGSPRGRRSNSHKIVQPLLEGAQSAGAQTEEIFLIEKNIEYCRGCFTCWGKTPGKCVINDDMGALLEVFLDSDYAGMATPVYGMYMTALLKNFTDRFLPLATPQIHKNEDGSFYHEGRVKKFPQQFFIANSGFPGEHNFDLLKAIGKMQSFILEVYRNCGEALNEPLENLPPLVSENIKSFYEALRKAGKEIVKNGQVGKDTIDEIHLPLMSDEEYIAGANQYWDEQA